MKRKRRKLKIKNLILLIFIIILINSFFKNISHISHEIYNLFLKNKDYEIIKLDKIDTYSGVGQEKVNNKDGYFTIFTTEEEYTKTYIEYKQNTGSWSNNKYWRWYYDR